MTCSNYINSTSIDWFHLVTSPISHNVANFVQNLRDIIIIDTVYTCADKFWPQNQIDWGSDSPQFLVDDIQFSADNSSIDDFKYKLSSLIKTPVIVEMNIEDEHQQFDWQLHYKFYDLMVDDLLYNYGIGVQKDIREVPFYSVQKKE